MREFKIIPRGITEAKRVLGKKTNIPLPSSLSGNEIAAVVASSVCGCGSCRSQAEPILNSNPRLGVVEGGFARRVWKDLRSASSVRRKTADETAAQQNGDEATGYVVAALIVGLTKTEGGKGTPDYAIGEKILADAQFVAAVTGVNNHNAMNLAQTLQTNERLERIDK